MIQSQRLDFRKIEESDFNIIATMMRDKGVQERWEHYFTDDDVKAWIVRRKHGYEKNGIDYLLAVDRMSREIVGQIGLLKEEIDGKEVWEIGYILLSRHYGNGYATEGAKAMADYAFQVLRVSKVICNIRPMNKPSIAVAKRLGMRETGVITKHYHGMEMPHLIFELDNYAEKTKYKIVKLMITATFGETVNTVCPMLLWDEKNIVLVDCGFIGSLPALEKELVQQGLSSQQLTGLVLTHHDHDHMGAAAALKRTNPNMKVYASPTEAPYISAKEKPLRLKQAEEMQKALPPEQQDFGRAFCDLLRRVEPVLVDEFLHDGETMDWCGGCRVIATPGHTPGHISLFMERDSIVITGDAMALEGGRLLIANPQFTLDLMLAGSSMDKLLSLKANTYYCYHGGMYNKT